MARATNDIQLVPRGAKSVPTGLATKRDAVTVYDYKEKRRKFSDPYVKYDRGSSITDLPFFSVFLGSRVVEELVNQFLFRT